MENIQIISSTHFDYNYLNGALKLHSISLSQHVQVA